MMGLFRAEIYKLVRNKALYICIAVTIGVVILMYLMLASAGVMAENSLMELAGQIFSGDFIPCILAIFVSIFVIEEYGSGMMKNVAGKGAERWKIFLAKLMVAELASVLLILAGIGAGLFGGWIWKGSSSFTGEFWQNLLIYAGLQILMEMALVAVYVLGSDLCRNYAAGISLGIAISFFPLVLAEVLDMKFQGKGFALSDYWLVTRSINCPYEGFTKEYVLKTILIAGLWFVLASGAGIRHFSRRDIN